jgi:hypothetical protein
MAGKTHREGSRQLRVRAGTNWRMLGSGRDCRAHGRGLCANLAGMRIGALGKIMGPQKMRPVGLGRPGLNEV